MEGGGGSVGGGAPISSPWGGWFGRAATPSASTPKANVREGGGSAPGRGSGRRATNVQVAASFIGNLFGGGGSGGSGGNSGNGGGSGAGGRGREDAEQRSGSGAAASDLEPTSLDMLEIEVARVKHVVAALELEDEEQLALHHEQVRCSFLLFASYFWSLIYSFFCDLHREQMNALRLIVTSLSTELQGMRGEIEGIEDELAAGI